VNAAVTLLEAALPALVHVTATIPGEHASASLLGVERMGTGFLIDHDGLLLTVNYVVVGASTITVQTLDGREYAADLVKHDFASGLAVLRIDATQQPIIPLGSSTSVAVGDDAFIVGSVGSGQARVGDGIVSYLGPFDANWEYLLDRSIFTTAMNPGLSLNMNEVGRFSMAVPVEYFTDRREAFLAAGTAAMGTRAWLGVFCYVLEGRLVIAGVMPGAPGDHAGLQPGDVVVAVDDQQVRERAALYRLLAEREPGAAVTVGIRRGDRHEDVRVNSGDVVAYFA
jgi:S1-C subfamily serine protease